MTDERAVRPDLPTGTVTFLRTDVEGSMALARALGDGWDKINAAHLGLIRRAVDAHGGVCVRTEGDAFFGVFPEAGAAVTAAIEAQRTLSEHAWPDEAPIRVRMGLHSGEAHLAGDDYGGFEVNRAARIAAAGHGGQIVLSEPTKLLADVALTDGVSARDLGRHVLRDVPAPERLFQLDIPGLRVDFPPLRTSVPSAGNLPLRMTSFLGRDEELAELRRLLNTNRLLTLTGPGGIGKTSLAVELARSLAAGVPDGAWFVALDEIQDPALVPTVIARTLGLFDGPERPAADGLARYLADRSILLVLDNFEHVLGAAGDVASILRASVGSRVVVTSRSPLHITGEQEYPIRPLAVGSATCNVLFQQRARAVRPGWEVGADTGLVEEVCGLLDGLPLGVELAAARISLLPVRAIRDRLAARLPLPGSGPRDAPDRQRTLDGAIAWSHDLLGSAEQRLLHDLSTFDGSFDVEQAGLVSDSDVFDGLATIVDQSLVARESGEGGSGTRFRMLQTIRAFAQARLIAEGREQEVRGRHAIAYLELAEHAAPYLPGTDQARWLDRLSLDDANLRTAIRWAIDAGRVEIALRLVAALWRYWQLDGHLVEGRGLVDDALAMPGAGAHTAARMGAITAAGGIAYWDGRPREAIALYDEELALARELDDPAAEVDAIFNLTYGKFLAEDFKGAQEMIAEAKDKYLALGDDQGVARSDWTSATLLLSEGRVAEAEPAFQDALRTFERTGDAWYHAMTLGSLGWSAQLSGRPREAGRWLVRAVLEHHALRDVATCTISLASAALTALEVGQAEQAAVLLGAHEGLTGQYGVRAPLGLEELITGGRPYGRAKAALDSDQFEAALQRGRRMSLDEAVALVARIGDEYLNGDDAEPQ
jgi:predicted ATPase/class 3 adenylate cyclase